MDQKRTGEFLSQLRREKGLTQKELADKIGVSDKTISKWEKGRSIPDLSYIEALCTALGITTNELISGERLSDESYAVKAEENIMNLINENESHKKSNLIFITIGIVLCFSAFLMLIFYGYGPDNMIHGFLFYLDFPTLLVLALMSCGGVFISGKRSVTGVLAVLRVISIPCGCLIAFITAVLVLANLDDPYSLGPLLAVTILSVIYALVEYIIVCLIQERRNHDQSRST